MKEGAVRNNRPIAELFDVIVETAPEGIIIADSTGEILSFSKAAERLFGYAEAEICGQNLSILMPDLHAHQHDEYMRRFLKTGTARIIGTGRNVIAIRADETTFVAHLEIGELKTVAEHLFVGFIRDTTAEMEAGDNARQLQRQLEQLGREHLVGEMSTALAHELNQPLTAIGNFAKAAARLLENDEGDLVKARSYLDQVVQQSLRTGEIVKKMRGLVERGQVVLKPDDINEIVRSSVRFGQTSILDELIEVSLVLTSDLPMVLVDRIQIQQVIINLLRNAREAVERMNGQRPDLQQEIATGKMPEPSLVEMKAQVSEDRYVMVTVSDTGPGVPCDMLQTIFDPMVTTKPDGFGVGLAICRSIIHAHGGHIWAKNNLQGGTDVHFTLKVAAQQ